MNAVDAAWLQFVACAAVITVAGAKLSRYGDVIAEKSGVSRSWVGLVLLAAVTSLPELVTGVSAVTIAGAPNIAVGDVFGSCVFNLSILVVVDLFYRDEAVFRRASQGHILSAGFGIILIGIAGLNLLLGRKADALSLGHVGIYAPVMMLLYLVAIRAVFHYEREELRAHAREESLRYPGITLRQAAVRYAAAALCILAAGAWLPFVGVELARVMDWHGTFVGTLFVAGATSLPELVVTIAALRIGAVDMAIANLLGSNLFNIAILAVDDLFYLPGPLLSHVSPMHAVSAVTACVMTGVVIVALLYRPESRLFRTVGWASVCLVVLYLLNAYVLYLHGE
ncbi:MAG: sodium:calcium antiporter [Burkholderiales bacterium]|nr:sodium:calcium antiporter [Burkholderiales bacterium]